jgi:hypothetical protein
MLILINLQKHTNLQNMLKLDMLLNVISATILSLQSKKIIFDFFTTVISFFIFITFI